MPHKVKTSTYYLPKVDYKVAKYAWFTHAGKPYSVVEAPASVFSMAVLERAPKWKYSDGYMAILEQDEIDYQSRWWLLCCLADLKRGMRLYQTREQAERACTEQVAG